MYAAAENEQQLALCDHSLSIEVSTQSDLKTDVLNLSPFIGLVFPVPVLLMSVIR